MKKIIKNIFPNTNFKLLKKSPCLFIYSCYLTWRFIDEYKIWPAVHFNGYVRVKFIKGNQSYIKVDSLLIVEQWLNGEEPIIIQLLDRAYLHIEREFTIGQGVTLFLSTNAKLELKGKMCESGSGITANSIIMVNKHIQIGYDCIIAWDTYITDCDWHYIENKDATKTSILKDHIWIGVGVKILKGVVIGENSIVTSNTVVVAGDYSSNSLIFGNPVEVKKNGASKWNRDMVN